MKQQRTYLDKLRSQEKRFAQTYAQMLISGKFDWGALIRTYNRTEQMPEVRAKRVLRRKHIQEMVQEELYKIVSKFIDQDEVISKRLEVLNAAIEKGDLSNANKALDSFDEKLDLKPVKQHQIQTTETNWIELLHKKDGETKKITAKEVKELPENGS